VRAAYAAIVFGLFGGLGLATAVLSSRIVGPATVAAALGVEMPAAELDRRRAGAVAVLVADCMTRAGLRWDPVPDPGPGIPDPGLGPVAWAERWGFGVSTLVGRREPAATADPNMTALDAAAPAVRDAYRRALHGHRGTSGCHAMATETVYGLRDRLLEPLRADLAALDRQIAADAGSARAVAAWRVCVGPVANGLAVDRRSLPGALLTHFVARVTALGPGGRYVADLEALQGEERRVATVVAGCEVAYAAARATVASAYEAAFVADHREALAGIGAAIRAGEAALPTLPP